MIPFVEKSLFDDFNAYNASLVLSTLNGFNESINVRGDDPDDDLNIANQAPTNEQCVKCIVRNNSFQKSLISQEKFWDSNNLWLGKFFQKFLIPTKGLNLTLLNLIILEEIYLKTINAEILENKVINLIPVTTFDFR